MGTWGHEDVGHGDRGAWGPGDMGTGAWGCGDLGTSSVGTWGHSDTRMWDLGTQEDGDVGTRGHEDVGRGDTGAWGYEDTGAWGCGDMGTSNVGTCRQGDLGTQGLVDMRTWEHGDMKHRDGGMYGRGRPRTRCRRRPWRRAGSAVVPGGRPVPEQHVWGTARPGRGRFLPANCSQQPRHRGSPGEATLPTAQPQRAGPCPDPLGTGMFSYWHGTARNRSPPPAGAPAAWRLSPNGPGRAAVTSR